MSGGKQKESKQKVEGWKPATDALERDLLPLIGDYTRDFGGGEGYYQGPLLADERLLTFLGQEGQLGAAGRMGGQLENVIGTLEGFLDYDPNSPANKARREAFSAQAMDEFNRVARPAIEDRGTFAGQFGGPQQDIVMGTALGDVGMGIAGLEAQMMDADRARAMQAMGMAPGLIAQQLMPGMIQEGIGDKRTGRDQQELDAARLEAEQARNNRLRSIMEIQGMLGPLTGTSTVTSGQTPGSNPFQGILGGALAGGSLGGPWGAIGGGVLGGLGSLF